MNILFAASEAAPFAKTGGLGDVIGSLPQELRRSGADVRVIMPKYDEIPGLFKEQMQTLITFGVNLGWRTQYCGIQTLEYEGVTFYFVDNEFYFRRPGHYGYGDDAERFAFYCRAVIDALPHIGFRPDVIHCHDWQAGMIPVLLRAQYSPYYPFYENIKTVLTIHNLRYQGIFSKDSMMDFFGLDPGYFSGEQLEMYDGGSFLKGGLLYTDRITAVSPTYAEEIRTPFFGENMDSLLRYRSQSTVGIVNGIDYDQFNPMTDSHLAVQYRDSLPKKRLNKTHLQQKLGLPVRDDVPVISLVTRLVEQKGIDLIRHVLPELLSLEAQWVIVGTGDSEYEQLFRDAAARYPDKLAAYIAFDDGLARQVYAGSDLFLMPSLFEPCGIGQLIAMRYRTVPIVRETGGLKDTVQPYNEFTGEGTGFSFSAYNAHDMLHTVRRAVDFFLHDQQAWKKLLANMRKNDYSWKRSAQQYKSLYQELIDESVHAANQRQSASEEAERQRQADSQQASQDLYEAQQPEKAHVLANSLTEIPAEQEYRDSSSAAGKPTARSWWKESVVYQIYPRSFMDSNGDGIGDLQGIISKLDYLKELGVDVIWLSPVYKSPNDDNGYDISDYRDIMDDFGTMSDWDQLLGEVHQRGMKLIMDLVVNHSSDEHPWFLESRSSKDSEYRDYYIWRPGQEGREPNNWTSFFRGPAWEYDEATDEYYLHLFTRKQPDLNWENPKVREEVYEMMTWWLDKGIDGFRMDVINLISKVDGLPSAGGERYAWGGEYFMNGPRIHEYLREMNEQVLSRYDIMTVGEMPGVSPEEAVQYANAEGTELNMVFQFEHMELDNGRGGKWDPGQVNLRELKRSISNWQTGLEGKAWNSLYLNNHDQPRMVSRFGDDRKYRVESAKMLATFLHTLQGTPYIYQGEEIGMTNMPFATIEDCRDIESHNVYREHVEGGGSADEIMNAIRAKGRDNARTPMQWNADENAGFTTGEPWLLVNPNYKEINAEAAVSDPNSVYHYYRKLIALRKAHPVIVYGSYELLAEEDENVFAYVRTLGEDKLLVMLNFSNDTQSFASPYPLLASGHGDLLIANYAVGEGGATSGLEADIQLRPYEARVYLLQGV
ncbi:glycogen synthase GlgA [Paenibacillus lutrae]|uniref:Glycogen synthase n=1 Tax=Paenibacillus lutrae TaxID=2078573 RepID=A0A7X3K1H3_9BACL|nr:glycogen synthase GlgA [Paenibacillus lutrae]